MRASVRQYFVCVMAVSFSRLVCREVAGAARRRFGYSGIAKPLVCCFTRLGQPLVCGHFLLRNPDYSIVRHSV